jgi:hypothetical protein
VKRSIVPTGLSAGTSTGLLLSRVLRLFIGDSPEGAKVMTREHILVLGLDEIQGIRLQCDLCNGAISFRLNETINIPQVCPGCRAPFVDAQSFSDYEAITRLVVAVKTMREMAHQKRIKATLKLEFNDGP